MKRTWTEVGKEHSKGKEEQLSAMFERFTWLTPPCTMGAMPGMNISEAIQSFKIPKVSQVAVSTELAPYGLYGIKGHYSNGDAVLYLVDEGWQLIPIATDFYPKEDAGSQSVGHL